MQTEKIESETKVLKKDKKRFFGCRSTVATVLFVAILLLNFIHLKVALGEGIMLLGLLIQFVALLFLLFCIYKDLKTKEYGIGKKIAVWVWDIFIAFIIISVTVSFANKIVSGYVSKHTEIHCDTPMVKESVKDVITNLLLEQGFVDKTEIKKVRISFDDIKELESQRDKKRATVQCKAVMKLSNVGIEPLEYVIDYNTTLDLKRMQIQSYITLSE